MSIRFVDQVRRSGSMIRFVGHVPDVHLVIKDRIEGQAGMAPWLPLIRVPVGDEKEPLD